jgi:hypothetical protein
MTNLSGMPWPGALLADNVEKMVVIGTFVVGGILIYKLIEVAGSVLRTRQTERTRREIAAYVAEGGMTPETAERLLKATAPSDWPEQVAGLMQAGTIDSSEAERLLKAGPSQANAAAAAVPPARA